MKSIYTITVLFALTITAFIIIRLYGPPHYEVFEYNTSHKTSGFYFDSRGIGIVVTDDGVIPYWRLRGLAKSVFDSSRYVSLTICDAQTFSSDNALSIKELFVVGRTDKLAFSVTPSAGFCYIIFPKNPPPVVFVKRPLAVLLCPKVDSGERVKEWEQWCAKNDCIYLKIENADASAIADGIRSMQVVVAMRRSRENQNLPRYGPSQRPQ